MTPSINNSNNGNDDDSSHCSSTSTLLVSQIEKEEDEKQISTEKPEAVKSTTITEPSASQQEQPPAQEHTHKQQEQHSWGWHLYLLSCAMFNIPFYGMAIQACLFGTILWYSVHRGLTWLNVILLAYLVHITLDTKPTRQGGYSYRYWSVAQREWMRNLSHIKRFAQYFPVSLHKTTPLPADQGPYMMLYHPHGVISIGACCALFTNACDFDIKYPGLGNRHGITLSVSFFIPLFREWMMSLGVAPADKSTLTHLLQDCQESIVLVPGGAAEALYAKPGTFCLYLSKRKGFVKLARDTNAKLVPVLGFGENDAFTTVVARPGSWWGKMQRRLCRLLSFSTPLFSPIPQSQPINVVVGPPVVLDPQDSVDDCHAQYLDALRDLYEQNKKRFGHEHIALEIR